MLKFTYPEENEKELLAEMCSFSMSGTEAYTILKLYEQLPDGSFFCGRDAYGVIKSLVFNNGDEDIRVFGEEFSELFAFSAKEIMVYEKKEAPFSDVNRLSGKEISDIYRLISGKNELSFDDERRYVYRLRCVNHSLAAVFGIVDESGLVSCACVSAVNEKYALIADVFTHPLYRNKGYAQKCVYACVGFALREGKIPFLRCEEKMCSYYERSGFSYYGKM